MKKMYTLWVDCTTLGYFNTLAEAMLNTGRIDKYIEENPEALEEGEPAIYEYEYDHKEGIMYTSAHLVRCYHLNGKVMCE